MRLSFAITAVLIGVVTGVVCAPAAAYASFGIDPGKVYIDNLYPGAQAEYSITVYNQGTEEHTYSVQPRVPDYTDEEYESFPHLDWITIEPEEIVIPGDSNAEVAIILRMPEDADYYSGKKGEVWISFKVLNDTDMIQIELASRLFISTRASDDGTPIPVTTDGNGSGDNSVGIIVEAEKTLTSPATASSSPEPSKELEADDASYSWLPVGITLGVLALAGIGWLVIRKRRLNS